MDSGYHTEIELRPGQLSARDWVRLVWGLVWRAAVLSLASTSLGGALGVAIGGLARLLLPATEAALEPAQLRVALAGLGFVASLGVMPLYLRWVLHARFGSLRLALIRTAQRP